MSRAEVMSKRPQIHFTPATGWLNDPHGITWFGGRYHLFHQYVPGQTTWGPKCHWAHISSPDLLGDWLDEGIALAPGDGDDGIWTGSLVRDRAGRAQIFYTSVVNSNLDMGIIRVARPVDDSWKEWKKGEVVLRPPEDLNLTAFRDPFVQPDGDGWLMHIGAGTATGTALALRYRSRDLKSWHFESSTLERSTHDRDPVWMGSLWECPQVIEIDGYTVMISSIWGNNELHYAGAAIGSMSNGRLEVETWERISHGDSYYAPSFFRDRESRPCVLFWMRGPGGDEDGWASALSVPHLLSVNDGRLQLRPHPDLTIRVAALGDNQTGDVLFIQEANWITQQGKILEFVSDSEAPTAVLRASETALTLERVGRDNESIPYRGGDLALLVDGNILEIWAGGKILGATLEPGSRLRERAK